jgi:hypothetical protein
MHDKINSQSEAALATSVLGLLIKDIAAYEESFDKKAGGSKGVILRNASDAIHCAFRAKNDSLKLWLALTDIHLRTFRGYLLKSYPRACCR